MLQACEIEKTGRLKMVFEETGKIFILGMGDICYLLISKTWMRRVRAIEDHGESILTMQGKDGVKRFVHQTERATLLLDTALIDGLVSQKEYAFWTICLP